MSELTIEPVRSKSDLAAFIDLPWRLYAHDPNWRAPLRMEISERLDTRKNPYFEHAEAQYFLARRGGRVVGRITAQIDRLALEPYGPTGYFGLIEGEDEAEIFHALLGAAENWLRQRGMTRIEGPLNLSINEEVGNLIDGFDTPPQLLMTHALPYYNERIEAAGYEKAKDVFAYQLDITKTFPPVIQKIYERGLRDKRIVVRNMRADAFEEDLREMLSIFNDAWEHNWNFVPFTEAEVKKAAKDLKLIIRTDLAFVCEVDGKPAAFMITLPNLNEAAHGLNGRLFPFGVFKLLWRLKVRFPKTVRVPLMGIRQQYQSQPIGGMMAYLMIEKSRQIATGLGAVEAELSWILENNFPMRRMLEAINCVIYKTYRLYGKALTP